MRVVEMERRVFLPDGSIQLVSHPVPGEPYCKVAQQAVLCTLFAIIYVDLLFIKAKAFVAKATQATKSFT